MQILHINRRTPACTRGGGGAPARLRSFYIIITPHVTFFAILPPSLGALLASGYDVGAYLHASMFDTPIPPMQSLYVFVWLL